MCSLDSYISSLKCPQNKRRMIMNKSELINELENMGPALLTNRTRIAEKVLDHSEIFPELLNIVFEAKEKRSIKAAWVLEIICANNLYS